MVIDETKVKDENDKSYHTDELIIDEVHRYTGVKDWFNNQTDVIGRVEIYALNANDGSKGYIIRSSHDEGREVIDNFLQNVDRHDNLHENYN
ncbi:MAG: hypothetical protein U5L96_17325 [Owenweeksia sp.]|nr:hypothetical protein [Owenweeksia sp.]